MILYIKILYMKILYIIYYILKQHTLKHKSDLQLSYLVILITVNPPVQVFCVEKENTFFLT